MSTLTDRGSLPQRLGYARPDGRYSISIEHRVGPIFEVHEQGYADDESGRHLVALFTQLLDMVEQDGRFAQAHLCVDYSDYEGSSAATRLRMVREVVTRGAMGCTAFYGAPWWTRTVSALLRAVVPRLQARHFDNAGDAIRYLQSIVEAERRSGPELPPPVQLLSDAPPGEPPTVEEVRGLYARQRALRDIPVSSDEIPTDPQELRALVLRQRALLEEHDVLLDRIFDSVVRASSLNTSVPEWPETRESPETDDFWAVEGALHLMRTDLAEMFAKRDRREAELATAREVAQEANQVRSQFLGVVSHELRTPLNAIVGLSALVGDSIGGDPVQLRRIEGITEASRRLGRLVDDLLDFTGLEAGALTLSVRPFDLTRILRSLQDVWTPRAEERVVELLIDHPPSPLPVLGDPERLGQVLGNLLDNAIKFTDHGEVRLAVHRRADGWTRFEVQDTGRGIPPEDIDRVFTRFEQSEPPRGEVGRGVGLGLTLCKRLVELMGGELSVRSAPGRGSVFEVAVELPSSDAMDARPTPASPHRGSWPGARVLVVEDDPLSRFVARDTLEGFACDVTVAADGVRGLEAWGREEFDLVLMDCQLPELDGFEASRAIRLRGESGRRRTPIVALTAYAQDSDRARARAAGMDGFLVKPVSREQLEETLDQHLPRSLRTTRPISTPGSETPGPEATQFGKHPRRLSILFDGTNPQLLRRLRRATVECSFEDAARVAHQLRGQAAILGAEAVQAACSELEQLGGWCDEAPAIVDRITREVWQLGDRLRQAAAVGDGGPERAAEHQQRRLRLMLVDDDPVVRSLSGAALERWGFEVEALAHPFEAIERVQEARDDFDLILLDYRLPEMDGLEVLDVMRETDPELPAVLCSGDALDADGLPPGAAYLPKPLSREGLVETIESLQIKRR